MAEEQTNSKDSSVDQAKKGAENDNPYNLTAKELYFIDGRSRIDFILAWSNEATKRSEQATQAREVFERNLMNEGLRLEYAITNGQTSYVKIHAPYVVLKRYADILKLRLPIKAASVTAAKRGPRDTLVKMKRRILKPFQYDRKKLPLITRSYTSPYSSSKEYLFDFPEEPEHIFSNATRSWIVDYILRRKYFADTTENSFACGINKMISDKIYTAAYPLHEGHWKGRAENPRKILYDCWAGWRNCFKMQPLDHIRVYFGETVALYFAWLGFYTSMLIPATVVGFAVFVFSLYAMVTDTTSRELCDETHNVTMCPLCDHRCGYWKLHTACLRAVISRIFDNGGTVFFAVFMSLWGTFFLEFWKREQATIQYKWDLTTFVEEEQPPRPEYLSKLENWHTLKMNPVTGMKEPYLPFWEKRFPRFFTSYSIMLLMVSWVLNNRLLVVSCMYDNMRPMTTLSLAVFVAVIAYRVSLFASLNLVTESVTSASSIKIFHENASLVTTVFTALINLIVILILNFMYGHLAFWLTDWEYLRTQSEYDNSITLKLFVFQFINCFSAIYYIAFFKGQFVGRPGKYRTLFGNRLEECDPAGCLIELCIQLAIIMVGRQLIQNNLQETVLPKIVKFIKLKLARHNQQQNLATSPWEADYVLEPARAMSLFYEYLEMVMQYGFLTIFCSAFPLGPLFALMNNIVEIRVDASKFVTQLQRPVAVKSASIGVWYNVLYAISRIAIITNALIIAFTSEFIPRFVYMVGYSKDGSLSGYTNFTLSHFNTSHFTAERRAKSLAHEYVPDCRYKDFRNPPWSEEPYHVSSVYWHTLAARLAFVCIFENVVVVITSLLSWLIPDIPADLREQIRRETYITQEIVLATELKRARGEPITEKIVLSVTELETNRYLPSECPSSNFT